MDDEKRLDREERIRYDRQLRIPEIGEEGQKRLKGSNVVIVGVGGLGCASATYLSAAGVGRIRIVDFDVVKRSDLNRQVLYGEEDIGKRKVIVAQKRLSRINSKIEIVPLFKRIDEKNVFEIIEGADVVVDGLDNLATRLIVNSACVRRRIPFIYGGVSRLRGMVTTIIPKETPCLACIFPNIPEEEGRMGVLGVSPALIGSIQALECIKIIIGDGSSLAGRLLRFNGNDMKFYIHEIRRNEGCKICS